MRKLLYRYLGRSVGAGRRCGLSMALAAVVAWHMEGSVIGAPAKVSFDQNGIFLVNGETFFPLGIWVYDLSSQVMTDIKEKGFNTVVGNGFQPEQLDLIRSNGMMALPFATEAWQKARPNDQSLLAWYITDEPEGHGLSPEEVQKSYLELKERDPNHPAGMCHYLFEAFAKYKATGDFTMSDVYPITSNRDVPLHNIGIHMDQARKVRTNPNHPVIPFIQDFGGPETEGGKWGQPTPAEVRAMAFIGLVHRASGVFIFSYWAKAPETWNSLKRLNSDLGALVPWLTAEGKEMSAQADNPAIEVRARKTNVGWLVMAVNAERRPCEAAVVIEGFQSRGVRGLFKKGGAKLGEGKLWSHFEPLEVKVYVSGMGGEKKRKKEG